MLPLFASASELAAGIARGDYTSRELVEAYAARISATRASLNAVVVDRLEQARNEADAADAARAAGRSAGPLSGVPITVKEAFDVSGLPTTVGHADRASHVAPYDAVAVSRLIAAGAIVLGKTNVPKDLADWQSFNTVYGATQNPWSPAVTPGGSSGGSAAALAAGLSALELGSDIAGSIRVPACYCGVWGLKPTFGVIPMRGHGLSPNDPPGDIIVAGPMARTASDLAIALDVMAGPDPADPEGEAWSLHLPMEPRDHARQFRIAIVEDDPAYPVDGSIRTALRDLGDALAREGARVDRNPALPMAAVEHFELFVTLLRGATSPRFSPGEIEALRQKTASEFQSDDFSYDAVMHRGLTQSYRSWLAADAARHALRSRWRAFFQSYDALICPVMTTPPFPHMQGLPKKDQRFIVDGTPRQASDCYYWIGIPSLSRLPAVSIPIGLSQHGTPLGAQIVGPEYGDKRCIRIAEVVERIFYRFAPPPAFAHHPLSKEAESPAP